MSAVEVSLVDARQVVNVALGGTSGGARAELEYILLLNGGAPTAEGVEIGVFQFRRSAVEIAGLLRRLPAEVRLDEPIQQLLRTQLAEIRSRQAAETSLIPLEPGETRSLLHSASRFTTERQLTDQQEHNLGQLLALRHGANFSVPGAGKTTTLLAVYEALRAREQVDRLLVVAPKNAFMSWEDEVALCFPDEDIRPTVTRLVGGGQGVGTRLLDDPEIALITYQLLPNTLDLVKAWARRHRVHVALDESHRVKAGYSGVLASAALELAEVAERRDILSGTPLPHAPEDLRPQLDFLWPGQRILPELRVIAESPPDVIEQVERGIRPLYVRTTKSQLDLPDLTPVPRLVELGPLQRELYELLRSEAARAASAMRLHDKRFFRLLGSQVVRLLQAASNPMLLTQGELVPRSDLKPTPQGARAWELLRELARYEQPAKVAHAVGRAEEIVNAGERVLIWSGFILNLTSLERLLAEHQPVVLYGSVPTGPSDDPDTREGRIRRFHEDPECRVMIANPAACGEGISLHRACHHALYLDRSFNAAHYLQSVDRIHRLGLPEGVEPQVEILEAADSIDQRVAQRLKAKIDAMARVLDDPGLAALAYDPEDVVEEFEGGIELDDLEEIMDHITADPGS